MMTVLPRARRRDKHVAKCEIVMKLWNESVAAGGMVTPGLGLLIKLDAPRGGFPITVIDERGNVKEYDDSLRSMFEQLTGKPGDELDRQVEV